MSEYVETLETDASGNATTTLEEGEFEIIGSSSGHEAAATTVTLDSDQSVSLTLQERTTEPQTFDYEHYLEDGTYTLVANHPDYWARIQTIGVSDDPLREDFTLQPYGDAIDTSGLTSVNSLTTESDGVGQFDAITSGEYTLEFDHENYQTKTLSLTHDVTSDVTTQLEANDVLNPPDEREVTDPGATPEVGTPEGYDPGLDLPEGDPYFEVAVLDTDAGADFEISALVTNAGGSEGATGFRLELNNTGEVIDRREMTLVSGGYTIATLSVRPLVDQVALPTSVTVSTVDDSETFELSSSADPRAVVGPGIPTTLGATATLGAGNPATFGRTREPPAGTGREFPEDGWALVLEQPNGDRRELTTLKSEPDIEDVHTKASSWSVTVPADRDLESWNFDTRAFLTRDGDIVNIGWCDSVESSSDGQETTLSGPGPFGELPGDDLSVEITQMLDWRAAQHIVSEVAPQWDITVLRTEEPLIVHDEEYSGNPLSIIKSFCEDYSLYFRPSMTHFRQATIFAPGGLASTVDLQPTSMSINESSEGYANEVVFRGGENPDSATGEHVEVVEANEDEIQRLSRERDIRIDDARETVRVEDADVTDESKARQRARGELRERVTNYESGGSIEMPARRIHPGLAHPMPFDDEVWHSARAVRLDGDASVALPARVAHRMHQSGAIILAVRAEDWASLANPEGRLFGIWGGNSEVRTVRPEMELLIDTDAGRAVRAAPFDDPPSGTEWHVVHYDWTFNPNTNETTVRAGHDGQVVETSTAVGAVAIDDVGALHLGRFGSDYITDTILEKAWFCSEPQSANRYGRLVDGDNLPASDLVARYDLDEPTDETTAYDSVGGWHGERDGTIPAGHPVTLDSASHSLTTTSGEFNKQATLEDALRQLSNQ